jgi:hypothetical protein
MTVGVISGLIPYSKPIEGYVTVDTKPIGTIVQLASKTG